MKKDHIIKIRVSEEERKILEEESEGGTISDVIRSRLFSDIRVYLYRYFNLAGELLYVGVTENLKRRGLDHKHKSSWFSDVASTKMKVYFSRILAEEAEIRAIQSENPKYNIRDSLLPIDEEYEKNKNLIDGKRNIIFSLSPPQHSRIKEISKKRGVSMKKIITDIIENWKDEE